MNYWRCFNVEGIKFYFSDLLHSRKLKFKKRGLYFRAWALYLSFGTSLGVYIKQLYGLLALINIVLKIITLG